MNKQNIVKVTTSGVTTSVVTNWRPVHFKLVNKFSLTN